MPPSTQSAASATRLARPATSGRAHIGADVFPAPPRAGLQGSAERWALSCPAAAREGLRALCWGAGAKWAGTDVGVSATGRACKRAIPLRGAAAGRGRQLGRRQLRAGCAPCKALFAPHPLLHSQAVHPPSQHHSCAQGAKPTAATPNAAPTIAPPLRPSSPTERAGGPPAWPGRPTPGQPTPAPHGGAPAAHRLQRCL